MAVSNSFLSFVLDQLAGLGEITSKRMFGGAGIYCGDRFFALIAGDALYLKADDVSRPRYQAAGMRAFRPNPARADSLQYYGVPVEVLESPDDLVEWAREALAAADRAASRKRPR